MGDKVETGQLIYTVFDTQWLPALKAGDKERVPTNRFFVVRLSVLNSGGAETTECARDLDANVEVGIARLE